MNLKKIEIQKVNLQDGLVVNVIKDGSIDLARLQGDPVEYRQPKLCLDWLLYLHSCTAGETKVSRRARAQVGSDSTGADVTSHTTI